jgi:hypothetical protein
MVTLAALAGGCAAPTSLPTAFQPATSVAQPSSAPAATRDWDNPIRGDRVDSLSDAQDGLAFQPRLSRGLGDPAVILLTPPGESDNAGRAVALIYDTSYGRIVLIESHDILPVTTFENAIQKLIARNSDPGLHGQFEESIIKGNVHALFSTGEDGAREIDWREDNRMMRLSGPSVSKAQLVSLADAA